MKIEPGTTVYYPRLNAFTMILDYVVDLSDPNDPEPGEAVDIWVDGWPSPMWVPIDAVIPIVPDTLQNRLAIQLKYGK
jgi:hypothetical protein